MACRQSDLRKLTAVASAVGTARRTRAMNPDVEFKTKSIGREGREELKNYLNGEIRAGPDCDVSCIQSECASAVSDCAKNVDETCRTVKEESGILVMRGSSRHSAKTRLDFQQCSQEWSR